MGTTAINLSDAIKVLVESSLAKDSTLSKEMGFARRDTEQLLLYATTSDIPKACDTVETRFSSNEELYDNPDALYLLSAFYFIDEADESNFDKFELYEDKAIKAGLNKISSKSLPTYRLITTRYILYCEQFLQYIASAHKNNEHILEQVEEVKKSASRANSAALIGASTSGVAVGYKAARNNSGSPIGSLLALGGSIAASAVSSRMAENKINELERSFKDNIDTIKKSMVLLSDFAPKINELVVLIGSSDAKENKDTIQLLEYARRTTNKIGSLFLKGMIEYAEENLKKGIFKGIDAESFSELMKECKNELSSIESISQELYVKTLHLIETMQSTNSDIANAESSISTLTKTLRADTAKRVGEKIGTALSFNDEDSTRIDIQLSELSDKVNSENKHLFSEKIIGDYKATKQMAEQANKNIKNILPDLADSKSPLDDFIKKYKHTISDRKTITKGLFVTLFWLWSALTVLALIIITATLMSKGIPPNVNVIAAILLVIGGIWTYLDNKTYRVVYRKVLSKVFESKNKGSSKDYENALKEKKQIINAIRSLNIETNQIIKAEADQLKDKLKTLKAERDAAWGTFLSM